jgi:hypothetical protein
MGRRFEDGPVRFAVLVPHRDYRRLLRFRSAELFGAGYWGAWSFPHVAPLARLSAPLTGTELKNLARRLRELSLAGGRDGMLRPGLEAALPLAGLPAGTALYGPLLDINLDPGDLGAGEKLAELFSRPLVGCAILGPDDLQKEPPTPDRRPPAILPMAGFRAAAVANLLYSPIGEPAAGEPGGVREYSYSWRIGKLHWLPPCPRKPGRPEQTGPKRIEPEQTGPEAP